MKHPNVLSVSFKVIWKKKKKLFVQPINYIDNLLGYNSLLRLNFKNVHKKQGSFAINVSQTDQNELRASSWEELLCVYENSARHCHRPWLSHAP